MLRNFACFGGISFLVITLALSPLLLLTPPASASGAPCYNVGSRDPVVSTVYCHTQCDYSTYCRYSYETVTYAYTVCDTGGSGVGQQCETVEKIVEERTRCMKDATKECDSPPWPGGCVSGGCAGNSNEYQCKVDPNRTTLVLMEDVLIPYEYFESCD